MKKFALALALVAAAAVNYPALFRRGLSPLGGTIQAEHRAEVAFQARAFSLIFLCNYSLSAVPAIVLNRFHGPESAGVYAALFRIVMTRLRDEPRTRAYLARRTTEGRTKREVIRCLKRYLARHLFGIIRTAMTPPVITPRQT